MILRILVISLVLSVLEQLNLVDGARGLQESPSSQLNLESKCNAYCFSILTPILDKVLQQEPESNLIEKLNKKVISLEDTTKDLQSKLAIADVQVKYKDDLLKYKDDFIKEKVEQLRIKEDKLDSISNLKNQLEVANCQNQIKDLTQARDNEVIETFKNLTNRLISADEQLKAKDDVLNLKTKEIEDLSKTLKSKENVIQVKDKQILDQSENINSMTVTISNLQRQLGNAEDEINVKNKEIIDKTEQVKSRDDIIKSKETEIRDKSEQIKNIGQEMKTKDNQMMNLSAQISNKDNEIDILKNQTKSDLEKISGLNEELLYCRGTGSCESDRPNGIYKIYKLGMPSFEAPCNSTGWMTIQRRQDGSVHFNRTWMEYKNGFGNITGNFFIGLEKLHQMTKDKQHELNIKLVYKNGETAYAHYDNFQIDSEQENYKLESLGRYSGTTGDFVTQFVGKKFSTFDRDNDERSDMNCANILKGGWWYHACYASSESPNIEWKNFSMFSFAELKIRPKS